ncbi:MAG: ubiquinol-cytochrome c reductase iron-sulfur subunit [Francisellaceae bacterium]|jgi:ubiquinol-cytochrome c reductase iron-sulfur subunit|nr:ubiquinol-cytochrome c reductase iron-sulfur subunit [Francisellaceae bacterium]MBT6206435.1 ubiquinol-cytochrome c reductase iron-sulfur subunit [Francisellaceae bacterium]MBT6537906.1 ubiquinol-cytochrome c reductase iron-sulfur subunit [Francisellaceae bacterium]
MEHHDTDMKRRQFLTAATGIIGGVGLGLASIPFVGSWLPSAKAKALGAPVDIDVAKIEPGQKITVSWRGQPIFVVHRTKEILDGLSSMDDMLRDPNSDVPQQPEYAKNIYRAINEVFFVAIGICTHLGCVPMYRPKKGSVDSDWPGGFFCPCHGSKFDMSGRVYQGVPAPTNLVVPPYSFISETVLRIGEDAGGA